MMQLMAKIIHHLEIVLTDQGKDCSSMLSIQILNSNIIILLLLTNILKEKVSHVCLFLLGN